MLRSVPHPLRPLITLIAAAALALAGALATATPARAQSTEDIVRFLLGAAAVAIIIRGIDDRHQPDFIDRWTLPDSCLERVRVRGREADIYNAHCLARAGYRNLPQHCEVRLRVQGGNRTGYEAGCLYGAGYRPQHPVTRPQPQRDRLPGRCELTYRRGNDRLIGYDSHCLRNAGFTRLPRRCELNIRGGGTLFDGQCLWDAGYRRGRR